MKKTARKTQKPRTRQHSPKGAITLKDMAARFRRIEWCGYDDDLKRWKPTRMQSVLPSIVGLLHGLTNGGSVSGHDALRLLRQGGGTRRELFAGERLTLFVAADWAARWVLPLTIEAALPDREDAMETAAWLRTHQPTMWPIQTMDVMKRITEFAWDLERERDSYGTAKQRDSMAGVESVARAVIEHLVFCLKTWYFHGRDMFQTHNAMKSLGEAMFGYQLPQSGDAVKAKLRASLPTLVSVLAQTDEGDSQRAAADRCVWETVGEGRTKAA